MTAEKQQQAGRSNVQQLFHLASLVRPPHYRDMLRWCKFTLKHTPYDSTIGMVATNVLLEYRRQIKEYQDSLDSSKQD